MKIRVENDFRMEKIDSRAQRIFLPPEIYAKRRTFIILIFIFDLLAIAGSRVGRLLRGSFLRVLIHLLLSRVPFPFLFHSFFLFFLFFFDKLPGFVLHKI